MEECCLFLRGEVYFANATSECSANVDSLSGCGEQVKSYVKVGNTSLLEANVSSAVIGRENVFNKSLAKSRVNIDRVELNITIECVSRHNLIHAFYGDQVEYELSTKEDRFCFTQEDKTYILSRVPTELTVSLVDGMGFHIIDLIENIDYTIDGNKLNVLDAELMPPEAVTLVADYEFENINSYEIDALSLEPQYKEVVFVGRNAAGDNDELIEVKYFRVLFKPIETFDLISKGTFFNLPLSGVVEESNNGWFKIKRQFGENDELGSIIY